MDKNANNIIVELIAELQNSNNKIYKNDYRLQTLYRKY